MSSAHIIAPTSPDSSALAQPPVSAVGYGGAEQVGGNIKLGLSNIHWGYLVNGAW